MTAAASPTAIAELDPVTEEQLAERRTRASRRLRPRSRRSALVILAVFGAAAGVLATTVHSDRSPSVATVVSLVLAYAIAANVEFEVRTGLTLPTELALVPMLFLLPLGYVPLFVA